MNSKTDQNQKQNNVISLRNRSIFKDTTVNLIDDSFQMGKNFKVVQQYVEGDNFSGSSFTIDGKEFKNFSVCSYLGLEIDTRIKNGIIDYAQRFGASFIMSRAYASASGFQEFERLLSDLFDAYPVVTPSTTLGHLSFVNVMIQKGDVIIIDQHAHNSIQMAAASVASKATISLVRHNDMEKLEKYIEKFSQMPETNNIWYMGDGIYSMSGAKAPMKKIVDLLNRHDKFYCYLDDAHGMTAFGKNGKGFVLSQMDKIHQKIVVAVSLSKAYGMGCGGALVFPNGEWQRKVHTCGPTMIFSSPIPPPMLGGGIASAKIHLSSELEQMQRELYELMSHFSKTALRAKLDVPDGNLSPVQFVKIGNLETMFAVIQRVFRDGYFVNSCGFPAVPKNQCGLRLTITRHTTKADIDGLVDSIRRALDETSNLSNLSVS